MFQTLSRSPLLASARRFAAGKWSGFRQALVAVAMIALLIGAQSGCENARPVGSPSKTKTTATPASVNPTNTRINARDQDAAATTPFDQGENSADVAITADIRKKVLDANLSTNANNIKIVTQDRKVTLRGPVDSEQEKAKVEVIARAVAGEQHVDNKLDVAR